MNRLTTNNFASNLMQLYILRHAQSANNHLYTTTNSSVGRQADPPLTELGHRQAQLLARRLAAPAAGEIGFHPMRHNRHGFGLTHLYTSLMLRAIVTASYVAEATGLPLHAWPEAHEWGGLHTIDEASGAEVGVPGPDRAFFAAQFPHLHLPEALGATGWWGDRGREQPEEFLPRARRVWAELLARHGDTDDRVALVTHGGFFQSLIAAVVPAEGTLGAPGLALEHLRFAISNVSISRIDVKEGVARVLYTNQVDFLPDDLITG
jgi:2,3-bisphosphoglycerate-dependent phosphoglycerate mutase